MKHKITIIGSGPAGLAAAIYAGRADFDVTVYAGLEPGGQLTKTTEIENYPGVVGKTGPELMLAMTSQAQKFGAKIEYEEVADLQKVRKDYDAVILAMGASSRMLGIGEEKYWGKGLSVCAVCDAAFYKGKRAVVVGGGDAAIEDALALTKFASSVTLVVRKDKLRASVAMQKRVLDNPMVKILWNSAVTEIIGSERIEAVVINEEKVATDGLFLAIGHIPATGFLKETKVELDEEGYVLVGADLMQVTQRHSDLSADKAGTVTRLFPTMTSIAGVFAAGDCVDHRYRQAIVAAGSGVSAFMDAEKWLESK